MVGQTGNVQLCHFGDDVVGEFSLVPIIIGDGFDFPVHKVADFKLDFLLVWCERGAKFVEVPVHLGHFSFFAPAFHHLHHFGKILFAHLGDDADHLI